jgi:serine/threonine protein phosphatase PrpC
MSGSDNVKEQVLTLFRNHHIEVKPGHMDVFDSFLRYPDNALAINLILKNQATLMAKWKLQERIAQIRDQQIRILNASVGKSYEARFDFEKFGWTDINDFRFEGLEEAGLTFNEKQKQITGNPTVSGDININFKFRIEGQSEKDPYNDKVIVLIINPNPRSLWKSIESDKNDPYWKENDLTLFSALGEKHLLISSKRGRAHANVGSFREDDFAFRELKNGWNIVVVSDGAGSAKLSRKGSAMACNGVIEHFEEESSISDMQPLDELLRQYAASNSPEIEKELNLLVYNNLGKAALNVHKKLEAFSIREEIPLKDLSCTLIFTLFKKYDAGYAFLSFGVGDCPIAVLNEKITEVTLLNWIDVGEFGGGTRFITMPEIFHNEKFASRFTFKMLKDFSYLFLMSDGIYDPKFVVESNLPDINKWKEFLADLAGGNDEKVKVNLSKDNEQITDQFSKWMDFWSTGNHDDRTLAIIF